MVFARLVFIQRELDGIMYSVPGVFCQKYNLPSLPTERVPEKPSKDKFVLAI